MKIKHLLKIVIYEFHDSTKYGAECSKNDQNIFYKNTPNRKVPEKKFYTMKNY